RPGNTGWRPEPTYVEKCGDEVWVGVKSQSNMEIAGSLRNSFRASLKRRSIGGRALIELGALKELPNSVKLRMPMTFFWESDNEYKVHCQEGNNPDHQLRSPSIR